jgi:hypothetical protein
MLGSPTEKQPMIAMEGLGSPMHEITKCVYDFLHQTNGVSPNLCPRLRQSPCHRAGIFLMGIVYVINISFETVIVASCIHTLLMVMLENLSFNASLNKVWEHRNY